MSSCFTRNVHILNEFLYFVVIVAISSAIKRNDRITAGIFTKRTIGAGFLDGLFKQNGGSVCVLNNKAACYSFNHL